MFGKKTSGAELIKKGLELCANNQPKESITFFDKALATEPDSTQAMMAKANALVRCGQENAALAVYDQLLASEPKNAKALYNKGCALVNLFLLLSGLPRPNAPYEEAIEYFDAAERNGHERASGVSFVLRNFAQLATAIGDRSAESSAMEGVSENAITLVPED